MSTNTTQAAETSAPVSLAEAARRLVEDLEIFVETTQERAKHDNAYEAQAEAHDMAGALADAKALHERLVGGAA